LSNRGRKRCYGRRKPRIQPRRILFIICEGRKTEYAYLKAIRSARRLRTVQIDIDPGCRSGSDPKSLVTYAKRKKHSEDYDDVWCVFDHDGRLYIDEVLTNAERRPRVDVAFSNPCFELWYLLHYQYSAQACNQVKMVRKLRQYIDDYTKSKDVFPILPDRLVAVQRAADLRRHHDVCGSACTENPSTSVDNLVQLLYSLDDPR